MSLKKELTSFDLTSIAVGLYLIGNKEVKFPVF